MYVATLSRRVAHATYALLAWSRDNPYEDSSAASVILYDPEAMNARQTGAALREAQKQRLVVRFGTDQWTPTELAHVHRLALEERALREHEEFFT